MVSEVMKDITVIRDEPSSFHRSIAVLWKDLNEG